MELVLQHLLPSKYCTFLGISCKSMYGLYRGEMRTACDEEMRRRLFHAKYEDGYGLTFCVTRTERLCLWLKTGRISMQQFWSAQQPGGDDMEDVTFTFVMRKLPASEQLEDFLPALRDFLPALAAAVAPRRLYVNVRKNGQLFPYWVSDSFDSDSFF